MPIFNFLRHILRNYFKSKAIEDKKHKQKKDTSKTWTLTLRNLDPEKLRLWKVWIPKNLHSEKTGPWMQMQKQRVTEKRFESHIVQFY